MPVIFETLADFCKLTTDPDVLTEYVRQALAKQITNQYKQDDNTLQVLTLSGKVEKLIADHIQKTEHGNYLALDPQITQNILESMQKHIEQVQMTNQSPIILCSPAIRMYVRGFNRTLFFHMYLYFPIMN